MIKKCHTCNKFFRKSTMHLVVWDTVLPLVKPRTTSFYYCKKDAPEYDEVRKSIYDFGTYKNGKRINKTYGEIKYKALMDEMKRQWEINKILYNL